MEDYELLVREKEQLFTQSDLDYGQINFSQEIPKLDSVEVEVMTVQHKKIYPSTKPAKEMFDPDLNLPDFMSGTSKSIKMQSNRFEMKYDHNGKQILVKQIAIKPSTLFSVLDVDLDISLLTVEDIKRRASSLAYAQYKETKKL